MYRVFLFIIGFGIICVYISFDMVRLGVLFWFIPIYGLALMGINLFGTIPKTKTENINMYSNSNLNTEKINADAHIFKSEIYLDYLLCTAITNGIKTELRTNQNLELINQFPDDWEFIHFKKEDNIFVFENSVEKKLIFPPFKLGSIVSAYISGYQSFVEFKIHSIHLQRFQDIKHNDAINEGFGIYEDEIIQIWEKNYEAKAELFLFNQKWQKKYGNQNQWLWVFGIEYFPGELAW